MKPRPIRINRSSFAIQQVRNAGALPSPISTAIFETRCTQSDSAPPLKRSTISLPLPVQPVGKHPHQVNQFMDENGDLEHEA